MDKTRSQVRREREQTGDLDHTPAGIRAKRAQSLPESVQFALITCLPNVPLGACWGFSTDKKALPYVSALSTDKNVIARRVQGGILVEVLPDYILRAITAVDPSLLTPQDINKMKESLADTYAKFEKWLGSSNRHMGEEVVLGIYCTNEVSSIKYKNTSVPAFRINLVNALALLEKYGFAVAFTGTDGKQTKFMYPRAAMNNLNAAYGGLMLSPTGTGVFIKVKKIQETGAGKKPKAQGTARQPQGRGQAQGTGRPQGTQPRRR